MSGKKRKKRKSIHSKKKLHSATGLRAFSNPFPDIPQDVLAQKLVEEGEAAASRFEDSWENLLAIIRSVDVLQLLAILSVHGLTGGMTPAGKLVTNDPDVSILQSHVELAQALALQLPVEQQAFEPPTSEKVEEIWNLLRASGDAFWKQRLRQIRDAKRSDQTAILFLQERLRSHTQFVRNWGFFKPVIRIARKLYSPLDRFYVNIIGVAANDLISIFEALVEQTERAIRQHFSRLGPILAAKTGEKAMQAYYQMFPDITGSPDEAIALIEDQGISREEALWLILSHADLRLAEIFMISSPDMVSSLGIDAESLDRALDGLSCSFGDLAQENSRHFILTNPVWTKPMIRLGPSRYFCPMPQLFFSFIFQIMDGVLSDDEKARSACLKRRSEFLENEVAELIGASFPGSEPARNFKWIDRGDEYETDLLVLIDGYLLLIEAKSGSISMPALRGAPARAKRHIQDLIVDPAVQSERLAAKILTWRLKPQERDGSLDHMPFDMTRVETIVRLSVTLEDFAMIQSNLALLQDTGWFDSQFKAAPTMTLADFEIVLDILADLPEKLHYLVRRGELEERVRYLGDELDLLGLYLETGFNMELLDRGEYALNIATMHEAIDTYYTALDNGFERNKPQLKSTNWWRDIRREIERKRQKRWAEVAVMLLNISYEHQVKIEEAFRKIKKNVKRNWRKPFCKNFVALIPTRGRQDAFAVIAYREQQAAFPRHAFVYNIVDRIFSDEDANRCLVIGVNIDRADYPYSFIGVFNREPMPHTEESL